jgi:hypothetical protein
MGLRMQWRLATGVPWLRRAIAVGELDAIVAGSGFKCGDSPPRADAHRPGVNRRFRRVREAAVTPSPGRRRGPRARLWRMAQAMRVVLLLVLMGGSAAAQTPTTNALAERLRVAEIRPDRTVLVEMAEGDAAAGQKLRVVALESFDDKPLTAFPILTVAVSRAHSDRLSLSDSRVFFVCADAGGGWSPVLEAKVVDGDFLPYAKAEGLLAVAWPADLDLTFAPADRARPARRKRGDDLPAQTVGALRVDLETESVEIDGDAEPERLVTTVSFLPGGAECRFPYQLATTLYDGARAVAHRTEDPSCFGDIPMQPDMSGADAPTCQPGDRRARCRWPPKKGARFDVELSPDAFRRRPFVGNQLGPLRGALRGPDGTPVAWIRSGLSFEGEHFTFERRQDATIEQVREIYLYHCAY